MLPHRWWRGSTPLLVMKWHKRTAFKSEEEHKQSGKPTIPVLFIGELGLDITNKRIKAGDGFSEWTKLPYIEETGLERIRSEYGDETDFILQLELNK